MINRHRLIILNFCYLDDQKLENTGRVFLKITGRDFLNAQIIKILKYTKFLNSRVCFYERIKKVGSIHGCGGAAPRFRQTFYPLNSPNSRRFHLFFIFSSFFIFFSSFFFIFFIFSVFFYNFFQIFIFLRIFYNF